MVDDRGQLLLVGAIIVAITIIGSVTLLNGLQYTDTAGTEGGSDALAETDRAEAVVFADLTNLVTQVEQSDPDDFDRALRANISTYNNYTQNMTVTRDGTYVNVSLNESTSVTQHRIGQTDATQYRDPNGPSGNLWHVINNSTRMDEFWLNSTSIDGGAGPPFVVRIENDSGDTWELRLDARPPSNSALVVDPPNDPPTECVRSDEQFNVSLYRGFARTDAGNCSFPALPDELDEPYDVTYVNPNRAEGTYTIVASGDLQTSNFDVEEQSILVPAIDYRYRSVEMAYNRTKRVPPEGSS